MTRRRTLLSYQLGQSTSPAPLRTCVVYMVAGKAFVAV